MDVVRVRDVAGVFVRREADAVGTAESIRHDTDIPRRGVESVDQLRQLRFRPETLVVAVDRVREPDGAVGMHDDVVGGVEGAGVVVVQQGRGLVRTLGFHVDQAGRFAKGALGAQDQPVAIVGGAIGHIIALGTADFVAGEVGGREELDFGDDNGLIAG